MTNPIAPGAKIADKYRILRTLGQGGMGVVYLAHHERLDRQVAIKLLHAQMEQQRAAVTRFEREIKAMALVNNRHIAHALDADVLDDGSLYLVMEYLEGHNLRVELRQRRAIPYPEAVAYIIQACQGIAAVHDVGIVHRDLKPGNLFLTELSGARCIKVLDFGVVKFLESKDVAVTEADVAVGTPLYMSPEQLRAPEDVSPRSDVWALGVVLYELIAGLSPFAAATPGAVVAAVMLDAPVSLSTLVPEVPEELARIVANALVKVPKFRIGSVRELAEQLAPFALPTDEIRVSSSVSPPPRKPMPARTSVRPQLAAEIESRVDAFGENARAGQHNSSLDELRQLPSFAKIAIAQGSDHMPTERPTTSHAMAGPFDAPTLTAARPATLPVQSQAQPPSPRRNRALGALGIVVLISGLLTLLVAGPRASGAPPALSPPARTAPSGTSLASAAQARPSPQAPSVRDPNIVPDGAPIQALIPTSSAPPRAASSSPPPARPKAATASARTPILTSPVSAPPVATDGKPLHL